VRRASLEDLDALVTLFGLYRRFYGRTSRPEAEHAFLEERLRARDSVVFLAVDDHSRPVGFVQLYPTFDSLAPGPRWVLSDLYVVEHARSQGWGGTLMTAGEDAARAAGVVALVLETARDNLAAQRLYERRGYQLDDVFLTYEKPLTQA
jgi:ribosomal protein S18 acetylase RimI-like enzyme